MDNFFILVLKFYIFYLFFFYGRALISTFLEKDQFDIDSKNLRNRNSYLLSIFGVIFLGNISFLFNFLFPLKSNFLYFSIVIFNKFKIQN